MRVVCHVFVVYIQILRSGTFNLTAGRETGEEGEQFFSYFSRQTQTRNMGRTGENTKPPIIVITNDIIHIINPIRGIKGNITR